MGGPVAQNGSERRPAEPEVPGSSPGGPAMLLLLLILIPSLIAPSAALAQGPRFDAVIVRGDIYPDWAVAMAYGLTHGSWVLHLTEDNEPEVLGLLRGLMSFRGGASILIVGQPNAISIEFEERLKSMGARVSRIGGSTRLETSLQLVIYYWRDCETVVISDGLNSTYYLAALSVAVEREAPIIYTKEGQPPEGFWSSLTESLPEVREFVIIGNSLHPDHMERLRSLGYSVSMVAAANATSPIEGGWNLWYALRELSRPLPLMIGLLAGSLLSLALLRMFYREPEVPSILDFLTMDERRLVEVVMEREEVPQEEIPELTGFSKPKVSRLVKDLIDRGIVERKKFGKTYLIRLSSKFRSRAA